MKQVKLKIIENKIIAEKIYKMILTGDTSAITTPGQFIDLRLPEFFLRRPISVSDFTENTVTLIYKVLGNGTEVMTTLPVGAELDALTGLGNGFNTSKSGKSPLLIGGGVGIPPLYKLAKDLIADGKNVKVALGFNSSSDAFYIDEFRELGCELSLSSIDGSVGIKGFVTDAAKKLSPSTYIYTCGPSGMLKAVYEYSDKKDINGEFSFEERMGCGFGACMGCSTEVKELSASGEPTGKIISKRICKEGPVLCKEEILW